MSYMESKMQDQIEGGIALQNAICDDACDIYKKTGVMPLDMKMQRDELLAALKAYESAEAMTIYGDTSDFVWPKREMRHPGETAWGWICEKHGLGYQRECICCRDEFVRHGERKNREARYARDEAFRDARDKARLAMAKATGEQQ